MIPRTLIVDHQCRPLQVLPWQRALCLTLTERAEALILYDIEIHTINRSYPIPSVVRMTQVLARGNHPARLTRVNVLTRDSHRCQYCGTKITMKGLTFDHVIPRSKGGKTSWTNIVSACGTCNHNKGDQTPEQAGLTLRRKPVRPTWSTIVGMRGFLCLDPHPTWHPFLIR